MRAHIRRQIVSFIGLLIVLAILALWGHPEARKFWDWMT